MKNVRSIDACACDLNQLRSKGLPIGELYFLTQGKVDNGKWYTLGLIKNKNTTDQFIRLTVFSILYKREIYPLN